jgi:hypothetical protein
MSQQNWNCLQMKRKQVTHKRRCWHINLNLERPGVWVFSGILWMLGNHVQIVFVGNPYTRRMKRKHIKLEKKESLAQVTVSSIIRHSHWLPLKPGTKYRNEMISSKLNNDSIFSFDILVLYCMCRCCFLSKLGPIWFTVRRPGGALWKHKICHNSFNNGRIITAFLWQALLVNIS